MRYVAALLLAQLAKGNAPVTQDEVAKILKSAGVECDNTKLSKLMADVKDKDLAALIAEGTKKMGAVGPAGGAASAPAAGGAAPAAAKADDKKGAAPAKAAPPPKKESSSSEQGDFADFF